MICELQSMAVEGLIMKLRRLSVRKMVHLVSMVVRCVHQNYCSAELPAWPSYSFSHPCQTTYIQLDHVQKRG